jgi:hypothetical protein
VGGLAGVSTENYKIKRFHKDIENGRYLLLVDVSRDQKARVEAVASNFSAVSKEGEDTTIVYPFAKAH